MSVRSSFHILLPAVLMLIFGQAAYARRDKAGLYQSPKGIGATVMFDSPRDGAMNIFTLRTDFYGFLSGRTERIGAFLSYTHDYCFFRTEGDDFSLFLHAGAGASLGFAHDYEKGIFSSFERALTHAPGFVAALAGNVGLCVDFERRLRVDISFSLDPGIHLRTDPSTGALLLSFYHNGIYRGYYPQINLMYCF